MGYSTLIDKNLELAFRLLQDLAVDAVFKLESGASFNFGTAAVETAIESEVTITVVPITVSGDKGLNKKSTERNVMKKQLLFRSNELGADVKMFTSVTFEDATWKIGPPLKTNGFTTLVDVYREVSDG